LEKKTGEKDLVGLGSTKKKKKTGEEGGGGKRRGEKKKRTRNGKTPRRGVKSIWNENQTKQCGMRHKI